MKRAIGYVLLGALITICLAKVANMEYQDQQEETRTYCEMVEEGTYPDYDERYSSDCKKYVG